MRRTKRLKPYIIRYYPPGLAKIKASRKREKEKKKRKSNELREFIKFYKAERGCKICDEREACCLSFHHLDPKEKEFEIGKAIKRVFPISVIRNEIAKCVILCENCHRKVHAGIISLPINT